MNAIETPWPERALVIRADVLDAAELGRWFDSQELAVANAFRLEKRRSEWLASRIAAKQLAIAHGLAGDPRAVRVERPSLIVEGADAGWSVSLSHSMPWAAAAIAREPVGIDIQMAREIREQVTHLFLTPEEEEVLRSCSMPRALLHFWCAKEAAFKRQNDVTTLKQTPIRLRGESARGLRFEGVETIAIEELVVAITV